VKRRRGGPPRHITLAPKEIAALEQLTVRVEAVEAAVSPEQFAERVTRLTRFVRDLLGEPVAAR